MKKYIPIVFGASIVLGAAAVFLTTAEEALWRADTQVPVPEIVQQEESKDIEPSDHPARLRIPALEVDAHVQEVGITASGNMATPNNFTDVGWYKYGTPPGFTGSAVIAGHVDNGLALPGVFKHLGDIQIGDDIYVESSGGEERRFRVVEIQTYPYTHVPRDVLFARRDAARLNLITCEGAWVWGERTYDRRLVVYAELAES